MIMSPDILEVMSFRRGAFLSSRPIAKATGFRVGQPLSWQRQTTHLPALPIPLTLLMNWSSSLVQKWLGEKHLHNVLNNTTLLYTQT